MFRQHTYYNELLVTPGERSVLLIKALVNHSRSMIQIMFEVSNMPTERCHSGRHVPVRLWSHHWQPQYNMACR